MSRFARPHGPLAAVLALTALGLCGCLDDPPTFAPRGQIPPFIIAGQVDPPIAAVYQGPPNFDINVPFRSEDVNIDLEARLYADLVPGAADSRAEQSREIPAGNFEELRNVNMDWTQRSIGCHSLTLILTYARNFDLSGLPTDDSRAARLVWWLNVGDTEGNALMSACPGASQDDVVPGGR